MDAYDVFVYAMFAIVFGALTVFSFVYLRDERRRKAGRR